MKTTVAIDIDGVLADYVGYVLPALNRITGKNLTYDDITDYDIGKVFGIGDKGVYYELFDPEVDFCDNLPAVRGAREFVCGLVESPEVDVVVVTSRGIIPPRRTREWVYCNICPGVDIVHCWNKARVVYDWLIDDCEEFCVQAAESGRKALLYDRPWNRKFCTGGNILRVKNFEEISRVLGIDIPSAK